MSVSTSHDVRHVVSDLVSVGYFSIFPIHMGEFMFSNIITAKLGHSSFVPSIRQWPQSVFMDGHTYFLILKFLQ